MARHRLRGVLPLFLLLAIAATVARTASPGDPPAERRIEARVDPRIELMSTVFRMAGNPEYGKGAVASYAKAVDEHFAKWKGHAVVKHAAALRRQHGVSYDAVASFAVHLDDGFRLAIAPEKAERLDRRWPPAEAKAFADELRAFAKDADAAAFFRSQKDLYDLTAKRMQALLDAKVKLAWFDAFFGTRPKARFVLELGLLNGGGCYGPSVRRADGAEDLHCVLGVWQTDDAGKPTFSDDVVPTVVHEFCHSYCNPLVEQHSKELLGPAERLWPFVKEAMAAQAYGEPSTLMKESLVRACVVRYVAQNDGDEAAAREIVEQHARSFHWTGELSKTLEDYESLRAEHPTLDAFMPKIARFFEAYAAKYEQQRAKAPHVAELVPKNGAKDVDPKLTAIVVTFDRAMMDQSWAVVGGGPHFPTIAGKLSYDESRRVLTIPVELKPGWDYEFWLNRGKFDSFQSEDGVRLDSVHVTFSTRGG